MLSFFVNQLTNEINKGLSSDLESNKFNGILRMELGSNPTQSYSLCVFCSLQNMGIFDFCFCSSFFVNVDAYGYMMVFLCEGSKGENRMENFQLGIRYYT